MSESREKQASQIHMFERDYFLDIHEREWPTPDLRLLAAEKVFPQRPYEGKGWRADVWKRVPAEGETGGFLWRTLRLGDGQDRREMFETVLRFPTAPLFGLQRKRGYQFPLDPVHQHTLRLLTSFEPTSPQRVMRLFLLFNGVNEIDYLGFYHTLSSLLISQGDTPTACLICPTPGHLTRYPLHGRYAEKPLQRFIADPGDLFRQYLRFMIEVQWILSTLVPVSSYPVTPGQPLLAESMRPGGGRCNSSLLGKEIASAWRELYEASQRNRPDDKGKTEKPCTEKDVIQAVAALRKVIGWRSCDRRLEKFAAGSQLPPPSLHVVGYSLGGYLAQSAFFAWPFALGTCTALCSGGALQDLRPVKIVHEDEWRSITHGLTFEVDCAMLDGRVRLDEATDSVCGVKSSDFGSYYRIFRDVFLQDPHGSYRARVSEFAPRLFFVVGGNDPIVPTNSLIQASPKGGINLIEIADLTHFIATAVGEWSDFWLPMVTQIISKLASRMEIKVSGSILGNLWNQSTTGLARPWVGEDEDRLAAARAEPATLTMKMIQKELDAIVKLTEAQGFVVILRNNLPAILMGSRMLHHRGVMPHFEDLKIRQAWRKIQTQNAILKANRERVTVIIPGRLNEWFVRKPSVISSKSRALAREVPNQDSLAEIWKDFLNDWEVVPSALWRFDPTTKVQSHELEEAVRIETSTPDLPMHPILNCLPDVWLGFSKEVFSETIATDDHPRGGAHEELLRLANQLFQLHLKKEPGTAKGGLRMSHLDDLLRAENLRIVRISAANATPDFMGERIVDPESAIDLLVHCALALLYSTPCLKPGDFSKGWSAKDRL